MTFPLPQIALHKDDQLHGFAVTDVTPLPDMRMVAYQLVHTKSGAHLLHLHNDDPENLFAIAFFTPPQDNTGLPHILEHTVLCGSEKYPVKDPFVELLKTSLATFLNAMTYPDKTVYPCASMHEKDFFNIADVYCDAVFHPLITDMHFKQEGYHFALAEPGNAASPLIIKGIVYNEMKGAYSDLDGIIERKTRLSVCPDTAYGLDSGGDPDVFPTLGYDQFVRFYKANYHPSNSRIFIYGTIPTERHLAFLNERYLSAYERIAVATSIAHQPRWNAPRRETVPYPIGAEEDTSRKAAVVMTFLTNDVTDALRSLSMALLDYYLLGNAASPLRKALIDSKLGEELTDSGYASDQRDTLFTVGLKGTEADRTDAIVDLVKATCSDLVKKGLDKKKVEAAFHRLELTSREIRPMYPLQLMNRVYTMWLYGADPLHNLRLNDHLAELRRRYESEPGFFEHELSSMIVENAHYTVITFVPDKEYLVKKEEAFRKEMEARKSTMSARQIETVAREAAELDRMQVSPNSPEALASLPRLSLRDVPPDPLELPTTVETVAGRTILCTDLFSNGLSYLTLALDLRGIEDDLVDYLPLYTEVLRKMGAAGLSYEAMAEREAAVTGGVEAGVSASGRVDDCRMVQPFLVVSAKALDTNFSHMLGVVSDRVLHGDLTDLNRLKDVVLQGRVHRQSDIVPRGNHYAALYAGRHLSRNCALAERLGGVTQLRLYTRLAKEFDKGHDALVERLARIREFLLARGRVTVSFVGSGSARAVLDRWLADVLGSLRDERPVEEAACFSAEGKTREGIAAPIDVSFVATVLPAVSAAHPDAAALLLLSMYLSFGYLWNEVRVRRGAYGARAGYDSGNGVFLFASYRDPCIKETLDTFGNAFHHIANEMDLSAEALELAVIGTVKALDQPIRPGQAVGLALSRFLKGETRGFRTQFRKRLLGLAADDIRRATEAILAPAFLRAPVCVLSSRERLTAANESLGKLALTVTDL